MLNLVQHSPICLERSPELANPHAKLVKEEKNVKASVRPKAKCKICGFEVTMIKKYLSFGPPIYPKDNLKMEAIGDWKISGG